MSVSFQIQNYLVTPGFGYDFPGSSLFTFRPRPHSSNPFSCASDRACVLIYFDVPPNLRLLRSDLRNFLPRSTNGSIHTHRAMASK